MKNRKIVIVAFLLVAMMLLGVGYAALTDELTITGELQADTSVSQGEFDADIYFSAAAIVTDGTGNNAVAQILDGRDDAKVVATHFTTAGQEIVAKFTITNDSPEFASILTPSTLVVTNEAAHDPVFTVTWSWSDRETDTGDYTLMPGESKDLWVTITLDETPTEIHKATFKVTFAGEQVDPDSVES